MTSNKKEQRRLVVLNPVAMDRMLGNGAADLRAPSLRQVRRILAAYRKEDAAASAHGNQGRKPPNALDESLKRQVLKLAQSTYVGCTRQHFYV